MYLKQFYLGCLAHASYLVASEGEAAVVDPRRDVDEYLAEAEQQGARIRYVLETHLHADFVSGHQELAARTGATIVFGARAEARFPHLAVRDGDELPLGKLLLRVLETPGHTPEGITILVLDEQQGSLPRAAFTGDTLFIGDVGRPDLAGGRGFTPQEMAAMLFDSLHEKLLRLPDEVVVYPAHGAGSLCGRNMSSETSSTIGEQRQKNYALQPMAKARFVEMMTADLPELPRYFEMDVELNRRGAPSRHDARPPAALDPEAVERQVKGGAQLLDVRPYAAFGAGHLPGALNVGLGGQFASWCGTFLDPQRAVVLVTEDAEQAKEAVERLARVGLERVAGFVRGGVAAWDRAGKPLARLPQMPVDELRRQLSAEPVPLVLDVRRPAEFQAGHVPGALNIPLDQLTSRVEGLDRPRPTAVICAGGYRSSAGAGILLRAGFGNVSNVVGGTSAWIAASFPTEQQA